LRAVGRPPATARARPRPVRGEAALLRAPVADVAFRLRAEGALDAPSRLARARLDGARSLPDLRVRARPPRDLPRGAKAAAGALDGRGRRRSGDQRAVLDAASARDHPADEAAGCRGCPRPPAPVGTPPPGLRRPLGDLPLR